MQENKDEKYSLNDIVNISKSFLGYLQKKWWLLTLTVIVGVGLGIGYYFIQKPKYEAVTTFILEEKSSGGGGLAGLASQFGLDIGGMGSGGSIFAGDNILDILKSRKIVQKVLLSKVDPNNNKTEQSLADYFLDYSGWQKKWSSKTNLSAISYKNVQSSDSLNVLQDSVLNLIYDYLIEKSIYADRLNKKGTIIKVQITDSNPLFVKIMTDRLVEEAGKLYLDIKTGTSTANINKMQRRADSLLALLNNKSYSVAASQMLDINPGFRTATVPVEIGNRDKTVIATVYAEVTKNLEASKLILSQQTPIIQILDRPAWPLIDKRMSFMKLCLIGGIVMFLLMVSMLGIQFIFVIYQKTSAD